jgi:5'-nucleotidase
VLGLELKFDLVISGVNRGYNIGTDILYSGTVAAATEAAILGLPAIAFSTNFDKYDTVIGSLDSVWDYFEEHKLLEKHSLYNVNIANDEKGFIITHQGGSYYSDSFLKVEEGLYKANGKCVFTPSNDTTRDTDAVMSGYNSITPLTIDMTDKKVFESLKK